MELISTDKDSSNPKNIIKWGVWTISVIILLTIFGYFYRSTPDLSKDSSTETLSLESKASTINYEQIILEINQTTTIPIPLNVDNQKEIELPNFAILEEGQILLKPTKYDEGEYFLTINTDIDVIQYDIFITKPMVDMANIKAQLEDYLGPKLEQYGITIIDLSNNNRIEMNAEKEFPPASIAKMTMAMLIMKDIDEGKYTLGTKITIQDQFKHSTEDSLGKLPQGTQVTVDTMLTALLVESNNTAWYHLNVFLGGSGSINQRTQEELGVQTLFLDPHIGTTNSIAQLFEDLYNSTYLTVESRNYIIYLLEHAWDWNREALGQGLPEGTEFANKIGNLWTDTQINFVDAAIIWGRNTDYVMVVLNEDIDWVTGKDILKDLSGIIYKGLNN